MKQYYLTHRQGPIRCLSSDWEWIWEQLQGSGTLHSSKLQYWSLTIGLFNVISRKLFGGFLPHCRDAVGIFYCLADWAEWFNVISKTLVGGVGLTVLLTFDRAVNQQTGASGRRYWNITLTCGRVEFGADATPTWSGWVSNNYISRCPWCSRYRRRKWTRRHEFKSWTRLIAFHIALIPLGKVWIQLFSLQLWVNSRTD